MKTEKKKAKKVVYEADNQTSDVAFEQRPKPKRKKASKKRPTGGGS